MLNKLMDIAKITSDLDRLNAMTDFINNHVHILRSVQDYDETLGKPTASYIEEFKHNEHLKLGYLIKHRGYSSYKKETKGSLTTHTHEIMVIK